MKLLLELICVEASSWAAKAIATSKGERSVGSTSAFSYASNWLISHANMSSTADRPLLAAWSAHSWSDFHLVGSIMGNKHLVTLIEKLLKSLCQN